MICGVGTDLVAMARLDTWVDKPQWLARILTEKELQAFERAPQPLQWLAGRWAAKEAVAKALGCGLAGCPAICVEVLADDKGCPRVTLYGRAKESLEALGGSRVWVSITHDGAYAMAYAVAEGA